MELCNEHMANMEDKIKATHLLLGFGIQSFSFSFNLIPIGII